tara:strand:- start:159 stop:389 length:231 start_codon:yes stop_codon:yes gene_type:complete
LFIIKTGEREMKKATEQAVEFALKAIRMAVVNPDLYKDKRSRQQYDLSMAVVRQATQKYELVFEGDETIRLINKIV